MIIDYPCDKCGLREGCNYPKGCGEFKKWFKHEWGRVRAAAYEMRREHMGRMSKKEAIDQLIYDIEMCKFDPMTGEDVTVYLNEESRKTIEAQMIAIEALQESLRREHDEEGR